MDSCRPAEDFFMYGMWLNLDITSQLTLALLIFLTATHY